MYMLLYWRLRVQHNYVTSVYKGEQIVAIVKFVNFYDVWIYKYYFEYVVCAGIWQRDIYFRKLTLFSHCKSILKDVYEANKCV